MATEARETVDLIGSDKVEGTAVYDANAERSGTIKRVMLEKRSGHVALRGTAPPSPSSSSKVRRSIRAIVGTGKITSVAATSVIITTRR